jgi:hypothetical protein
MKTLSVLFTAALLLTVNGLATHLKRVNALPSRPTTTHSIYQNTERH